MKPDLKSHSLAVAAVTLLLATPSLRAQVGHDPSNSPYQTLRYGQFVGLNIGYLNGSGGQIGVAPHSGPTFGLRYDFLGERTLTLGLSATLGRLERFIVDKNKPIETGRTGPFKQNVGLFEAVFQFNVTGGKTWHGLAPYASIGAGAVLAGATPADTSGFKFRLKGAFTPGLGARYFLTPRLFMRIEAKSTFWQVSYPVIFRRPPFSDPTKPPVITGLGKEWVTNAWYSVGLSYAFHRPF